MLYSLDQRFSADVTREFEGMPKRSEEKMGNKETER
jgi:hypothetical protein